MRFSCVFCSYYLSFPSEDQATAARALLNRRECPVLGGRQLQVNYSRSSEHRGRREGSWIDGRADNGQHLSWLTNRPPVVEASQPPPTNRHVTELPNQRQDDRFSRDSLPSQAEASRVSGIPAEPNNAASGPVSELPGQVSQAKLEQMDQPQPDADMAQPTQVGRTTSGELLPLNRALSQFLETEGSSQDPQALETEIQAPEDSDTAAVHDSRTNINDNLRSASDYTLETRSSRASVSTYKTDTEAGVEPRQMATTQMSARQNAPLTEHQPTGGAGQHAVSGLPNIRTQVAGGDSAVEYGQLQAQGNPKDAKVHNKPGRKKKAKSKLDPVAKGQALSGSQSSDITDDKAGTKAQAATASAESRQPQIEAATGTRAGKQSQKKANRYSKNKSRGQEGQASRGSTIVSAGGIDRATAGPTTDHTAQKGNEEIDKAVTTADGAASREMARGDSSSSHEAAPTPVLGQSSTQPTTYAASEVSEIDIQDLRILQSKPPKAHDHVQEKEKNEDLEVARQDGQDAQPAVEKTIEDAEATQASWTTNKSTEKPVLAVIPAIPDMSKLRQLHRNEQRLQNVQQRLENVTAATDSVGSPERDDGAKSTSSRKALEKPHSAVFDVPGQQ